LRTSSSRCPRARLGASSLLGRQRPAEGVLFEHRVENTAPPEDLSDLARALHTRPRGRQLDRIGAWPVGTRVEGRRVQTRVA